MTCSMPFDDLAQLVSDTVTETNRAIPPPRHEGHQPPCKMANALLGGVVSFVGLTQGSATARVERRRFNTAGLGAH